MQFNIGQNRIYYKSTDFTTSLDVVGKVSNSILSSIDIIYFIEEGDGVYYHDCYFNRSGRYTIIVYENGIKKAFDVLTVGSGDPTGNVNFII